MPSSMPERAAVSSVIGSRYGMPPALMTASLYLRPIRELLSVMAQEMPMTVFSELFSEVLPDVQELMTVAERISAEVKKIVFIMQI